MKFVARPNQSFVGGITGTFIDNGTYSIECYSDRSKYLGRYKITPKEGFFLKVKLDYYSFGNDKL